MLPDTPSIHPSLVQGQEQSTSRSEKEEEFVAKTPESLGGELEVHSEEKQGLEAQSPTDGSQTSESQDLDSSIMVGTPLQMRWMLKQKQLYIDHEGARTTGARLIAKATSILDNKRQSDWSHKQRIEVAQALKKYGVENELTFVVNFMGWILGKTRKTPLTDLSGAELQEERKWIDAEWEKDHLHARWNIKFIADYIPAVRSGDAYMDKLIDQAPRIEQPKPDIAWGLYEDAFTKKEKTILENQKNHLAGLGMYDVFFVLEAKSINASLEEAENQYMRSGCAIVNTRRNLNHAATLQQAPKQQAAVLPSSSSIAGLPAAQAVKGQAASSSSSVRGPPAAKAPAATAPLLSMSSADMDSFAFTIALGSQDARMYANWARVKAKGGIEWHMHQLRNYNFRSLDEVNRLHYDIDNILDWGVSSRKRKVVELCKTIEKKQLVVSGQPAKKVKMATEETD